MNPTIKARIESIRRGEVPEGYKRTKAGILPVDWEFNPLSQLAQKSKTKNREERYTKILTNSANEGIISQTDYFDKQIANNDNIEGYYIVKKGDFVYNPRISGAAPCGPINCYHGEETGVMSPLYTVFSIDVKKIERDYVEQFFSSTFWHRYMKSVANYGVRSDRMNLSDEDFFLLPIPMPMRTEQEKIAEILAGQDRVIALKEKLLAEKQKQKKYLMQQLFMHDIKEWIRLSEIANVIMGQSPDSKYYNDKMIGLPLLQGNADLKDGYPLPRIYTTSVTKKCEKNDILLSVRAPVGCVFRSNIVACIGRGISAIRSREHQEYLYHFLIFYEEKWKSVAQGSTFEAISGNDIRNLLIPIVADKEKVCKVLSTADKEIELLRKDIEQEKLKKKSLMQLLLTGIVRIKEGKYE